MGTALDNWVNIQKQVFDLVRTLDWHPGEHMASPGVIVRAISGQLEVSLVDTPEAHSVPAHPDHYRMLLLRPNGR
jgi:hypothetical protein